jgi:hypothetical protein
MWDMKNVYDGVATLNSKGEATVKMPRWFEALNRDFRYQLTAIGASAPNLHIAKGISKNTFSIAGGKPKMKVSWQITGIRKDRWAEQNRVRVEENKPPKNAAITCTRKPTANRRRRMSLGSAIPK